MTVRMEPDWEPEELLSHVTSLAPHASRDVLFKLISICHGHLDEQHQKQMDVQRIKESLAKAALAERALECLARGDAAALSQLLSDEPEIMDVLNDEKFMIEWRAPGSGTGFDNWTDREGEGLICFLVSNCAHNAQTILKCAQILLEAGFDNDRFGLGYAIGHGHPELVLALIESGGSWDDGYWDDPFGFEHGAHPLYIASTNDTSAPWFKPILRLLLDYYDEAPEDWADDADDLADYVPGEGARLVRAYLNLRRVWIALRGCARVTPALRRWRLRAADVANRPGGTGYLRVAQETRVGKEDASSTA